jgi:hypothetical protein
LLCAYKGVRCVPTNKVKIYLAVVKITYYNLYNGKIGGNAL